MKKKWMEYEVYDHVISLGDSCQVAHQLNRLGLRYASYPFDWLFTWESGTITRAIETDFANWLLQENLEEGVPGDHHRSVHDKEYGAIHQHIFPVENSVAEAYDDVKTVVDRRIHRFLSLKDKKLLFVRVNVGRKDPSLENIALLENALVQQFGTNIHLMVLIHSREFEIKKLDIGLHYTSVYEIYNEGEGEHAIWTGYDPHWDLLFQNIKLVKEAPDLAEDDLFLNFHGCETTAEGKKIRWTTNESTIDFRKFAGAVGKIILSSPFPTRVFVVNALGEQVAELEIDTSAEYCFEITWETRFLKLKPETIWRPSEKFGTEDERTLGVVLEGIRVDRDEESRQKMIQNDSEELPMKKKICFIVQRYGLEVNGGAELHCRQLAEHMLKHCAEVHVLTSKAIDYMTWKDEYKCDEEDINGVCVHRFSVSHTRNQNEFNSINAKFFEGRLEQSEEREWIEKQGPAVPGLIDYLKENKDNFDAFIFFTYLYYPTVLGIKEVWKKAIVIPTAHDEPFLRMRIFDDVFKLPQFFFFNTEEERKLIHRKYKNEYIPSKLGGVGVELPESIDADRFREKYKLDKFILYVGRIDEGKNCHQLFSHFQEYKKRNKNDLKLVLMGKAVIPVPKNKDIISLGFVDDQDKYDGMAAAEALVLPSEFESLSMVVLEAMSVFTPVVVNGKCDVLRGHCIKSNGAFYYNSYHEFEGEINYLLTHPQEKEIMCENAKKYVEENYTWETIEERLLALIEAI